VGQLPEIVVDIAMDSHRQPVRRFARQLSGRAPLPWAESWIGIRGKLLVKAGFE